MSLPTPLLFGVLLLLGHAWLAEPLPGDGDSMRPLFALALLPLPWLATQWLRARVSREILWRGVVSNETLARVGLPAMMVPLVYGVMLFAGHWPEFCSNWLPESRFVQHVLLLGPLVGMDLTVRLGEQPTAQLLDRAAPFVERAARPSRTLRLLALLSAWSGPIGAARIATTLFLLVPILAFAAGADAVFANRRFEAFFNATTLGASVGMAVMVLGLCALLPLCFRWTMRTSRELPSRHEDSVRRTAEALDFPRRDVLALDTNRRSVNAALVGPLPWPRYLVLTDGILDLLDPHALRGVVAHEIGHARGNHPAWLLTVAVVIPLLLLHPLSAIDLDAIDPTTLTIVSGVGVAGVIVLLRRLFHRFEYEADQHSAEALGGVAPCLDALRRVGELAPGSRHSASFRHPSEAQRVQHLLAWATDPAYRERTRRAGRTVRLVIVAAALLAAIASVSVHVSLLPFDRATYAFYSGDFAAAVRHLDAIEAPPPSVRESDIEDLRATAVAAMTIVGDGGPGMWHTFAELLADTAWDRALAALESGDTEAARPWLSLAVSGPRPAALRRSVFGFVTATADEAPVRATAYLERARSLAVTPREKAILSALSID